MLTEGERCGGEGLGEMDRFSGLFRLLFWLFRGYSCPIYRYRIIMSVAMFSSQYLDCSVPI